MAMLPTELAAISQISVRDVLRAQQAWRADAPEPYRTLLDAVAEPRPDAIT